MSHFKTSPVSGPVRQKTNPVELHDELICDQQNNLYLLTLCQLLHSATYIYYTML
jgi:hypothetical protein